VGREVCAGEKWRTTKGKVKAPPPRSREMKKVEELETREGDGKSNLLTFSGRKEKGPRTGKKDPSFIQIKGSTRGKGGESNRG